MGGRDHADKFIKDLNKNNQKGLRILKGCIRVVADQETCINESIFKLVGDGVYEFKKSGMRLYAFKDCLEGHEHFILCTNGGKKNTPKEQDRDIKKAESIKDRYFEVKSDSSTRFEIQYPQQ